MRVFAYSRVSRLGDDSISPEIQRDAIAEYCAGKGWEVVAWFQDLDLSGRAWDRKKRRGLDELMERALAGECDAVVMYRIDRLAREEEDFHAMLAALQRAGVVCDSPSNPNDGSAESSLIWSISAALAKYESVRLGARLRDAHAKLARMGRWNGGVVPYGWRRIRDEHGTRLEADPDEATWRRWMHEQYHRGWSCLRIAHYLNEHGIPTRRCRLWTDGCIWNMLQSPYQVGARQTPEGLQSGGNVEALISIEAFERTLALMTARHTRRGRIGTRLIPGRVVRCGNCGGPMVAGSVGSSGRPKGVYECLRRKQGACASGVSIRYELLIAFVEEQLFRRVADARGSCAPKERDDLSPLAQQVDQAKQSLGRLALMRAAGKISEEEFVSARALQRKEQEGLEAKYERARRRAESSTKAEFVAAAWENLGQLTIEAWGSLSLQARRDIIELLIDQVVVDPDPSPPGHHAPAAKRVRIRWR